MLAEYFLGTLPQLIERARLLKAKIPRGLPRDYGAPVPLWGYAGHPLVYRESLICTVGGQGSAVVAFDKHTGRELWKALTTSEIGIVRQRSSMLGALPSCSSFTGKASAA